jgi:hypothetical protein
MKIGIVPFGADRVEAKAYGRKSCQSGRTLCNGVAQQKGFSNSLLTVKVSGQPDSQLESRMQEICQSGSGGGAVLSRPYLILGAQRSRRPHRSRWRGSAAESSNSPAGIMESLKSEKHLALAICVT